MEYHSDKLLYVRVTGHYSMCLAIPVKIISFQGTSGIGEVGGVARKIDLTFIEDPRIGEYVLLHAGFAIQKINEEDARQSLDAWHELNNLK